MNKPAYLGLSTLEITEIVMHEFLYDFYMSLDQNVRHLCRNCKRC